MPYSVTQLITRAYYLSQVVARDLQTVSGSQLTDGLYLLNAILEAKGSDVRLIPYFTRGEFLTTLNPETGFWNYLYKIPNMVSLETLTFNIGPIQFPMQRISRVNYFATSKIDNVQALPFSYHTERQLDAMWIYLYFAPGQQLPMRYTGKFTLTDVTATTDLTQYYDLYYIEYLRHALCEYICNEWAVEMPSGAAKKFAEIRKKLMDVSPPDLSTMKGSTLQKGGPLITFGQVNISPAWTSF